MGRLRDKNWLNVCAHGTARIEYRGTEIEAAVSIDNNISGASYRDRRSTKCVFWIWRWCVQCSGTKDMTIHLQCWCCLRWLVCSPEINWSQKDRFVNSRRAWWGSTYKRLDYCGGRVKGLVFWEIKSDFIDQEDPNIRSNVNVLVWKMASVP